MRKRKEIAVEPAGDNGCDSPEYRIMLEYTGLYENMRSPVHVATIRAEHAEQLYEELERVIDA